MKLFIKLEYGNPVGHPLLEQNVRDLFTNIEWPTIITPGFAASIGYGLYEQTAKPSVSRYQKAHEITPQRGDDGIWYQSWEIISQNAEEIAETDSKQAKLVRLERDSRLFMTDWTQIPNSELEVAKVQAYADYRSQLRKVSEQAGFPWEVIWPEIPK